MKALVFLMATAFLVGYKNASGNSNRSSNKIPSLNGIELAGTMWNCVVAEGCVDYFNFLPDSDFVSYCCEADYKCFGKFYVKNDTLFIYKTSNDIELTEKDCFYGLENCMYKMIYDSGKLKFVEKWDYSTKDNRWNKSDYTFRENYVFERHK